MNSFFSLHNILIALVAICLLFCLAGPTLAAESSTCFGATFLQDIAGNRSKIIQLSIVFVLVGIALLFKK